MFSVNILVLWMQVDLLFLLKTKVFLFKKKFEKYVLLLIGVSSLQPAAVNMSEVFFLNNMGSKTSAYAR